MTIEAPKGYYTSLACVSCMYTSSHSLCFQAPMEMTAARMGRKQPRQCLLGRKVSIFWDACKITSFILRFRFASNITNPGILASHSQTCLCSTKCVFVCPKQCVCLSRFDSSSFRARGCLVLRDEFGVGGHCSLYPGALW